MDLEEEERKYQEIADDVHGDMPVAMDYLTLREFCVHHGIALAKSDVSSIGKKLSSMSKDTGTEIKKRYDERYGSVNTYSVEVLREEFTHMDLGPTTLYASGNDQFESEIIAAEMEMYMDAMKRSVWIDATHKEHEIVNMNIRHMKATMAMLDRDHWPKNIANGFKKLFTEAIKNKPKIGDVNASELTERLMSAENNMWKSRGGLISYKDMEDGHLAATMKMISRFDWPEVLKEAYLSGMRKEQEKRQ